MYEFKFFFAGVNCKFIFNLLFQVICVKAWNFFFNLMYFFIVTVGAIAILIVFTFNFRLKAFNSCDCFVIFTVRMLGVLEGLLSFES